jgi:small subunit ribosomal protein S20
VANTKSAEKAARQAIKHRAANVALRSRLRTAIRKATEAGTSGNAEKARSELKSAQPIIDSMVSKGLIHRNKAARHKSRLAAKARAAAKA